MTQVLAEGESGEQRVIGAVGLMFRLRNIDINVDHTAKTSELNNFLRDPQNQNPNMRSDSGDQSSH